MTNQTRRKFLGGCTSASLAGAGWLALAGGSPIAAQKEVLPKHVTPDTLKSRHQGARLPREGSGRRWCVDHRRRRGVSRRDDGPGGHGPAGSRQFADARASIRENVQGAVEFLVRCGTTTGLITGPSQDSGQPMHGHGFALMFLASVYGMITKESLRQQVARHGPQGGRRLPARGRARKEAGRTSPARGDEGSVTVTQVQALRAAHNAGFLVPKAVIEEAVQVPGEVPDPRRGHRVFAPFRRRPEAADLGGGRRHAIQRRPVRQRDRHRLPQIRLGPVPRHRRLEQGGRARVLYPPLCLPGLLHGGRPVLGQVFPADPRPAHRHARPRRVVERRRDRPGIRHLDRRHHPAASVQVSSGFPTMRTEGRDLEHQRPKTSSTSPSLKSFDRPTTRSASRSAGRSSGRTRSSISS